MSEASRATETRSGKGRVGTVVNGVWRIDERLGSGGMATVYAATHADGRRAALKMLHLPLSRDADVCARFRREAYVANTIAHPGIVAVLDDDVAEDGSAFLVLELLEGETLETRRLREGGSLPVDEVVDVVERALEALAAAHGKGILHRDVKPENVFITNDGRVKLLDFGLAQMKDAQREATKTGVTIGTPEFMPPEQARGRRESIDVRSDVWGVGATLFTSITGEYVHSASTLREQLLASATQRARPLRSVAPHVPSALAQVVDRALELEKEDRWPSAIEMQIALQRARTGARDSVTMLALSPPNGIPSLRSSARIPSSSDPTMTYSAPSPSSDEPTINRPIAPAGSTQRDLDRPAPPSSAPMTPSPTTARLSGSLGRQISGGGTILMSTTPSSTPAVRTNDIPQSPHAMPTASPFGADPASTTIALPGRGPALGPPSFAPTTPRMTAAPPTPAPMSPPVPTPSLAMAPRSSGRLAVIVSIVLVLLVGAIGAYMLWRATR